eukprot:7376262-Prymnesium_polylepis.1
MGADRERSGFAAAAAAPATAASKRRGRASAWAVLVVSAVELAHPTCSRERHASLPGAFETATAMTICGCVFWAALEAAASCRR